ncbi:MAG TPA: DUF4058 domain-containing protein [Gemmataceae bacterium]|nr:DUF4058 domain-containing protein [Gemmataceae bacterium]
MPLNDHFHPPLKVRRSWTSFHAAWATYVAEALNERLPEGYFAEPSAQFAIEIDVATWEEPGGPPRQTQPRLDWTPPAPQATLPLVIVTDLVEVRILRGEGGPILAGAVEFVSPSNKDRPVTREAFVSKCAAYLQQGAGLLVADIVTERRANLHRDLLARVSPDGQAGAEADLYAAAYRPFSREGQPTLEVWHEALRLGGPLPTLPLWLRGGFQLPIDLEATYERTCQKLRVPANGA